MDDVLGEAWEAQRAALGTFLRTQRELSKMSLRELSRLTRISNAYLSQVERGLHDPTLRVVLQIGDALQISAAEILRARGRWKRPSGPARTSRGRRKMRCWRCIEATSTHTNEALNRSS
jgi:transcriptional regulator with XRE-family HTH domain